MKKFIVVLLILGVLGAVAYYNVDKLYNIMPSIVKERMLAAAGLNIEIEGVNMPDILSGKESSRKLNELSPEQKTKLVEKANEKGASVVFGDNGEVTISAKGYVAVQKEDGTWEVKKQ